MNGKGEYTYCPIFDNGAGLLADTTIDYPLNGNIYALMEKAKPKTFCQDFDEQLEITEKLYGQRLKFYFTKSDVINILEKVSFDGQIKERVKKKIIQKQMV